MDVYEIQVDLRPGVRDVELVAALETYLGGMVDDGRIESWRLLRRKLGLGAGGEFKVLIETRDLAQLDEAFRAVSSRTDPVESPPRRELARGELPGRPVPGLSRPAPTGGRRALLARLGAVERLGGRREQGGEAQVGHVGERVHPRRPTAGIGLAAEDGAVQHVDAVTP
jgi:hypothetical protein